MRAKRLSFRHLLLFPVILAFLTSFPACRPARENATSAVSEGKIPIIVSVEPQVFLVESVGGDTVDVSVLVPVGKEPENFLPTPEAVTRLARSQVYFRIGFGFEEPLLSKLKTLAPDLDVADFRRGIAMRPMELHSHARHADPIADDAHDHHGEHCDEDCDHHEDAGPIHGEDCDHENCDHHHGGLCADADGRDVHTWMSTANLKRQATTVCETLSKHFPENADLYRTNLEALHQRLDRLYRETATLLEPYRGRTVYVFHPAYGYFCDEFGLHQKAIEFEGRSPLARELGEWIKSLSAEKSPTIFVQPQFNRSAADTIAGRGGARVVVHSPLQEDPLEAIAEFARLFSEAQGVKP